MFHRDARNQEHAEDNGDESDAGTEIALRDDDEEERKPGNNQKRSPKLFEITDSSLFFLARKEIGEVKDEGNF